MRRESVRPQVFIVQPCLASRGATHLLQDMTCLRSLRQRRIRPLDLASLREKDPCRPLRAYVGDGVIVPCSNGLD
jgi:hypothetical protein